MADRVELSKTAYQTRDEAAMGGFLQVQKGGTKWEIQEYGFWVIFEVDEQKGPSYHYTTPQTDRSGGNVKLETPVGHIVHAHCHTHPKSVGTEDFSTGDKESFIKLRKHKRNVVYYLLTPMRQIRLAAAESDFLAGKPIPWLKDVTP
jgi:hypothetical protein